MKGKGKGRGKGRGRPKAKGKSKAAAKSRGRPAKGKSKTTTPLEQDEEGHPTSGDGGEIEVEEGKDQDDLMNHEQDPSAGTNDAEGGDVKKPTQKRKKMTKQDADPKNEKTLAKPPKESKSSKRSVETEEPKERPPKKPRSKDGGMAATFARRVEPSSEHGKAKWHAIREAFVQLIRPNLIKYSKAEDSIDGWGGSKLFFPHF